MGPEDRIERLDTNARRLIASVQQLADDVLYREPQQGEWSVMSTLAHLAEMLPYWAHEAERIASSPGIAFGRTHDDPKRIAAVAEHGGDSLQSSVGRVQAALDECLTALRGLPDEAWHQPGVHPRRGSMTIAELTDSFLVHHVEEHAKQIDAALDALRPTKTR